MFSSQLPIICICIVLMLGKCYSSPSLPSSSAEFIAMFLPELLPFVNDFFIHLAKKCRPTTRCLILFSKKGIHELRPNQTRDQQCGDKQKSGDWNCWVSLAAQMVRNLPQCGMPGFNPWFGKIPWRRARQPTPVFLPGKSHRERSTAG